eukprot:GHVN01019479.1.p1 GENE.GHVN01019479.1~~GHVN01019479.1.p1  ORF type:complete len:457 (+),score=41.16 GHVN01019479.1:1215-2585(+)
MGHGDGVRKMTSNQEHLIAAVAHALPSNYQFEVEKTVKRILLDQAVKENSRAGQHPTRCLDVDESDQYHVILQFPEGFLIYAPQIAEIIAHFTGSEVTIMGDVTYGACCIDDIVAKHMGADFLVHYGHSCLVPLDETESGSDVYDLEGRLVEKGLSIMYVFVEIDLDPDHLVETVKYNLPAMLALDDQPADHAKQTNQEVPATPMIAILGTIQFSKVVHAGATLLKAHYGAENILMPQTDPLTSGEVLGCTSPKIEGSPHSKRRVVCVFVADGRFHLEAAMIQNPTVEFFRYDPFTKNFLRESYAHDILHRNRQAAIHSVLNTVNLHVTSASNERRKASVVGLLMSTLGRQGSVGLIERLIELLEDVRQAQHEKGMPQCQYAVILMSEILPDRLDMLKGVDVFVQVGCPRLSIDWGHHYPRPLLNPYEAFVALGNKQYQDGKRLCNVCIYVLAQYF